MKSVILSLDSHMAYSILKYVSRTQKRNLLIRINLSKPFS
jgi:hypothetical protein